MAARKEDGVRVIVNADDFGRSREINEGVVRGHREGILTGASLMVAGEAAEEAVALAKEMPGLAVGLHLVMVDGPAVLGADRIPRLVDERGWFANEPVRLGLKYFLDKGAREELGRELEAQFERFAATGLRLAHVDGHQHMHVHPRVFGMVVRLAERYGAKGIRLPRDEVMMALRHDRTGAVGKAMRVGILGVMSGWCARQLQGRRLVCVGRTYGIAQSGRMEEAYVMRVLQEMHAPAAEIYFHPTVGQRQEELGPNPEDLRTLLSPAVRQIVEERGLTLGTYLSLDER